MKWNPYPKYRTSEIKWLNRLPHHWREGNIRRYAKMKTGHTPSRSQEEYWISCTIPWFTLADVWQLRDDKQKYLSTTKEKISELGLANSAAELLPSGTVVYSRTASIGYSGIMPLPMATTQDFWNWICGPSLLPEYLLYFFRTVRHEFDRLVSGSTHKTIYQSDAASLKVCIPPISEQQSIAAFLDRETSRIDRLLEKKRELIERLKEKRTAIISRTVTRGLPTAVARAAGLPKNSPLKPSGIDWLGDIPEHWEIRKFSREVAIAEGQINPEKEPYASMLLIGPEHVESGTGRLLQRATAVDQAAESGKYLSRKGDVIYSKIRPALRKLVIAPEDCLCSADMYPLRGRSKVENRFLAWFLLSDEFSGWSVLESDRVAMPKINRDTLNELRIPVPPIPEQNAIAEYLDRETSKLDALVGKVDDAVERLQEYRTAVITAAVTGKIDVSGITLP